MVRKFCFYLGFLKTSSGRITTQNAWIRSSYIFYNIVSSPAEIKRVSAVERVEKRERACREERRDYLCSLMFKLSYLTRITVIRKVR